MQKTSSRFRRSLVLLSLPVFFAAAILFLAWQNQPGKSANLRNRNPGLQFTSGGHVVAFAADGVYVAGGSHALHVEFVNPQLTNPASDVAIGDSRKAKALSKVTYSNLWDGVTLSYDAPNGAIARTTYRIDPEASVESIRLRYNAPISVQNNGALRVQFESGSMNESAPMAWQERQHKRVPIEVAFAKRGQREVGFAVGQYDRSEPLFIDPTLTWNTFLGGEGTDEAFGLVVDSAGDAYVSGFSTVTWGSPVRPFGGVVDAYAAKLDTNGNLIWSTFIGGTGVDEAFGLGTDANGNVYVAGTSDATWGAPVRPFGAGQFQAFAAKLDPNGNLIWNTFLGGDTLGVIVGRGIATDASGNAYAVGRSSSDWGAAIRSFSGGTMDGFAAKLDPNGVLIWNTFLGASGSDESNAVTSDALGNVFVAGDSDMSWGSPIRAHSGGEDGFVARLNPSGILIWNTFLGSGIGGEDAQAITLDTLGNVYVAGTSQATWGTPIRGFGGLTDAYAAKLNPSGQVLWSTFLGDGSSENGTGIALDGIGNIIVGGFAFGTWGSPDPAYSGGFEAYAAKLDPNGNLVWNGFVGSAGFDFSFGAGVDLAGNVYLSGYSDATWGTPIRSFSGGSFDAFVAKLAPSTSTPTPSPTPTPTPTATPTPTPTPSPTATPGCEITTSMKGNFNGTAIPAGSYIWFNGVLKPSGLGANPVTFRFTNQTITSANFSVSVPDSAVTFDPSATSATTTFSGGMWVTRVPSSGLSGKTFLSAVAFQTPANIPGGVKNVTWSGVITSDQASASLQWQWAAAVYTIFTMDYNLLGVKPVDDNHASVYQNSDHAGTPEFYKAYIRSGATGGGGANYTGGYTATVKVEPCP